MTKTMTAAVLLSTLVMACAPSEDDTTGTPPLESELRASAAAQAGATKLAERLGSVQQPLGGALGRCTSKGTGTRLELDLYTVEDTAASGHVFLHLRSTTTAGTLDAHLTAPSLPIVGRAGTEREVSFALGTAKYRLLAYEGASELVTPEGTVPLHCFME